VSNHHNPCDHSGYSGCGGCGGCVVAVVLVVPVVTVVVPVVTVVVVVVVVVVVLIELVVGTEKLDVVTVKTGSQPAAQTTCKFILQGPTTSIR